MFLLLGGLLWALAVPYPFLWSAIASLANLIPYLGMTAAGILCASFSALIHQSPYYLLVLLLFWTINIIENNFITPYFVGKTVQINPLAILIGALIGFFCWGFSGAILSLPILISCYVIAKQLPEYNYITWLIGENNKI